MIARKVVHIDLSVVHDATRTILVSHIACDEKVAELGLLIDAGRVGSEMLGYARGGDAGCIERAAFNAARQRCRKHLGQDGLIIIVASLDVYDGHVISGPDIVSRGFVYVRESEGLLDEVRKLALSILEECAEDNVHEWGIIKNRLREEIAKLISQKTRRTPMILPILQEV